MLVTCATFNYAELLNLLLASHRDSNPQVPLTVHAIGWPENYLAAVRALYPDVLLHAHDDIPDDGPRELKGPVPRSSAILRMKVRLLHESYLAAEDAVTWVDADTLMLAPLSPLLDRLRDTGDFAVTYRPSKRKHARFAVAVMTFLQNPRAARLLQRYAELTSQTAGTVKRKARNDAAWFHDQVALWQAWREQSRGFLGLPRRDAPRLMALSEAEHSIQGFSDAIFVSRRDRIFDVADMQRLLAERSIAVPSLHDAAAQSPG